MAQVELTEPAIADLHRLIETHSLPPDTDERILRRLEPLQLFPLLGPALEGRWAGQRYVLGPWRWMLLLYAHLEAENRVVVTAILDARSKHSPTSSA